MRQHGSFGVSGGPARELQICNIVRTYYSIKDVQNVVRYAFRFLHKFFVLDEIAKFSSDQADGLQIWERDVKIFLVKLFK